MIDAEFISLRNEFENKRYGKWYFKSTKKKYLRWTNDLYAKLTLLQESDSLTKKTKNEELAYYDFDSNFDNEQKQKADEIGSQFIDNLEQSDGFDYLPEKEYMINISSILSLTAWQEYHQHNYDRSMFYIDRIFHLGIANEEDYLLKAKLKRTLSNSYENNLVITPGRNL